MTQIDFPKKFLDHGKLVFEFYKKLINKEFDELKIPNWFLEKYDLILENLYPLNIMEDYLINHDCGKHIVEYFDEFNKPHYPEHAESSYNYYLKYSNNLIVANLIRNDMFFHICSAEDIDKSNLLNKDLLNLLIASLAEIHANASMFGGFDSVSFKSKYKHLDRRGNRLFKERFRILIK